jgi:hypothetical protein
MSQLEDQLNLERRKLERAQRDWDEKLPGWKKRIADAEENARLNGKAGLRVLEEVQSQFELLKGFHESANEQVRERIAELEAQLDQETRDAQDQARAALTAQKEAALKKWLLEGGTKESFTNVWPTMEAEILKRRVMAAEEPPDLTAAIAEKRARFGL